MMNGLNRFVTIARTWILPRGVETVTISPLAMLSSFASSWLISVKCERSSSASIRSYRERLLPLAPLLATDAGGRVVVQDAPFAQPRDPPAVTEVVLLVGRLARVRPVDELAVRVLDCAAGVDPAAAGRLAVVGHVG